jgi:hypothetical protein
MNDGDTADDGRRRGEVPDADVEPPAWDARQVWEERVLRPRRRPAAGAKPPGAPEGWDPLHTWQERVLKPRRR